MNRQDLSEATPRGGFVHLHCHNEYSALDGMSRVATLPAYAKQLGFDALATTNHGNLDDHWAFAQSCKKAGIKPILGCEIYLAIGSRFDPQSRIVSGDLATDDDSEAAKDSSSWETEASAADPNAGKVKTNYHLTVLAATLAGWRNLVALMNKAQETYWYKPLADFELLAEHGEGLIVLTGCLGGPVAGPAAEGDMDLARRNLETIIDAVGHDNVYIEVMDHGTDGEHAALKPLGMLADEYGLPMVATNDAHHTTADEAESHVLWLASQSKKAITDEKRFKFNGDGYHLRSEEEMRDLWPNSDRWQEACDNTVLLADRIADWVLPEPKMLLPKFPLIPEEFDGDSAAYLHHLVVEGAYERYGEFTPELKKRLRFEEDVIVEAGFPDYFLIVWELIHWADTQGIQRGPGRGSVGGSALAYCLGITDSHVEPMENGLLFERFLEIGRVGMPDIDLDFEKERTEDIRAHLRELYGFDCVARIGTFSTAATRKALKSAARTLFGAETIGAKLAKLVPIDGGKPMKLSALCDRDNPAGQAFRETVDADPDAQLVVNHARVFEDVVDGVGMHACGVIVSPIPLTDLIPLRKEPADKHPEVPAGRRDLLPWMTEWEGPVCEQFGLLKVDVLGLRTLDVVAKTFQIVAETTGEQLSMAGMPDPDDLSDPRVRNTYDGLAAGRTTGVFQLESEGITELTKQVGPQSLADLTAIAALYRPGPMSAGSHTAFADRKTGRESSTNQWTDDPDEAALIDAVFADTYNLLVYQEQIMHLSGVIAGYNAAERSKLRKAVGKKDKAIMAAVRAELVPRACAEQYDEQGNLISPAFRESTAAALMDSIEACGSYLFNKSHSATYGYLSFVTAYLKANWPVEFAAATLAVTEDKDKRQTLMLAFGAEHIEVAVPHVNTSGYATTAVAGKVAIGLSEISDVTAAAASAIIAERDANGPYTGLSDLISRVKVVDKKAEQTTGLSSTVLTALVEAGALDGLGHTRLELVMALYAGEDPVDRLEARWPDWEMSARQRRRIGVLVGEHPMVTYADLVASWRPDDVVNRWGEPVTIPPTRIAAVLDDETLTDKKALVTAGLLTSWSVKAYARGQMARFTLEAADGRQVEGVMWHESLAKLQVAPVPGTLMGVSGWALRKEIALSSGPGWDDEDGDDDLDGDVRVQETTAVTEMTASQMWVIDTGEQPHVKLMRDDVVVDFEVARARLADLHATGKLAKPPVRRTPRTPAPAPAPAAQTLPPAPARETLATVSPIESAPSAEPVQDPFGLRVSRRTTGKPRNFPGSSWFWLPERIVVSRARHLAGPVPKVRLALAPVDAADMQSCITKMSDDELPAMFRAPLEGRKDGFVVVVVAGSTDGLPMAALDDMGAAVKWRRVGTGGGLEVADLPAASQFTQAGIA